MAISSTHDPDAPSQSIRVRRIGRGLGKRMMFGSDQMAWPETISMAVEAIQSADFLSVEQKADIFYNNAARFLRLSEEEIAAHHSR